MDTPSPDDRPDRLPHAAEADRPEPVVPDPHRGDAAPGGQEGLRPEADADIVRPEEDEPGGPLVGLVAATSAQVAEEATPDGDAATEALLAQMGVEEEGVESGQLLGFVVATLLAVASLAIVLIYLIYTPFRGSTQTRADDVALYPELQQSRVDARAKLDQATRTGEAYTVPIGRAMGLVAAQYGGTAAEAAGVPTSRQGFNTLMVNRTEGHAIQRVALPEAPTATAAAPAAGTTTDVEVGVDDALDTPEPRPDTE